MEFPNHNVGTEFSSSVRLNQALGLFLEFYRSKQHAEIQGVVDVENIFDFIEQEHHVLV